MRTMSSLAVLTVSMLSFSAASIAAEPNATSTFRTSEVYTFGVVDPASGDWLQVSAREVIGVYEAPYHSAYIGGTVAGENFYCELSGGGYSPYPFQVTASGEMGSVTLDPAIFNCSPWAGAPPAGLISLTCRADGVISRSSRLIGRSIDVSRGERQRGMNYSSTKSAECEILIGSVAFGESTPDSDGFIQIYSGNQSGD